MLPMNNGPPCFDLSVASIYNTDFKIVPKCA